MLSSKPNLLDGTDMSPTTMTTRVTISMEMVITAMTLIRISLNHSSSWL